LCETDRLKEKLRFLFDRYLQSKSSDFWEQDTATKFIKPLLEILGWDTYDISEVKEEVRIRKDKRSPRADCVLYHDGKPYIVLEIKGLGIGNLPRTSNDKWVKLLMEQANELKAKYAVLTSYSQTVIFDAETNRELAYFGDPKEYISSLENLCLYLSKERATKNG